MALLRLDPAELLRALTLGTVTVPARVVVDLAVAAAVAMLDVPAESGGATAKNRSHHTGLLAAESRNPVGAATKDVGKLDLWATRAAV